MLRVPTLSKTVLASVGCLLLAACGVSAAFLRTLTDEALVTDAKFSDPFRR